MSEPQMSLDLALVAVERPAFTDRTLFHVGVSGGKDSAAALLWMVRESGIDPSRIRASWSDIGNDHEWTREHVDLLSRTVHPIETIKPARNFFELAMDKHRFPSTKARFCTEHLKILPAQEHITRMVYAGNTVIAVSGVRADESEERKDMAEWDYSGALLCYSWRPLIRWTLADVLAIHERHGIPLNPLYAIGAQRVGCWPCIMSRKAEIRTIALKFPERIDQIRVAEQAFAKKYGRYSTFFPPNAVPPRFRSMPHVTKAGETVHIATIDDVVRWSMTGDRAQGSYLDGPQKDGPSCQSGFCE